MKFIDLQNQFRKNGLVDLKNVINYFGPIDRRRFYEWQQKGYLKKLASNFYMFPEYETVPGFFQFAANKIYAPSYVGLESALSYYGLIPEQVFQLSSVSTLKTRRIKNNGFNFRYNCIKQKWFWGYDIKGTPPFEFLISTPEKTIIDYLYLNPGLRDIDDYKGLRVNQDRFGDIMNARRARAYLNRLHNKPLTDKVMEFFGAHHVGI